MTTIDLETKASKSAISAKTLRSKLTCSAKAAGVETIEKALILYYTLQDPKTPAWCKGVIGGALAYFISFIDGIPDLTPVLGYTDDLGVMVAAIATIASHISEENKLKSKEKAQKIFS